MTEKNVDMKKLILSYLQDNLMDLKKQLPLVSARFEDEPPRLVLVLAEPTEGPIVLKHRDIQIPTEVELKKPNVVLVVEDEKDPKKQNVVSVEKDNEQKDEVYHKSLGDDASKMLGIGEALGPHSSEATPKNQEAYKKWAKRHTGVKIVESDDSDNEE